MRKANIGRSLRAAGSINRLLSATAALALVGAGAPAVAAPPSGQARTIPMRTHDTMNHSSRISTTQEDTDDDAGDTDDIDGGDDDDNDDVGDIDGDDDDVGDVDDDDDDQGEDVDDDDVDDVDDDDIPNS